MSRVNDIVKELIDNVSLMNEVSIHYDTTITSTMGTVYVVDEEGYEDGIHLSTNEHVYYAMYNSISTIVCSKLETAGIEITEDNVIRFFVLHELGHYYDIVYNKLDVTHVVAQVSELQQLYTGIVSECMYRALAHEMYADEYAISVMMSM